MDSYCPQSYLRVNEYRKISDEHDQQKRVFEKVLFTETDF